MGQASLDAPLEPLVDHREALLCWLATPSMSKNVAPGSRGPRKKSPCGPSEPSGAAKGELGKYLDRAVRQGGGAHQVASTSLGGAGEANSAFNHSWDPGQAYSTPRGTAHQTGLHPTWA